jgi:hypothetical protein
LQAQVSLQFLSWTKLTMALATGSQHMNLLAPASGAAAAADGAQAAAAVDPAERIDGNFIVLAQRTRRNSRRIDHRAGRGLHRTDGLCGRAVSGAYVRQALTDVDYIRRVTFNVALVSQVTPRPYACRAIAGRRSGGGRKAAGVTGFVDREGGSFLSGVVGAVCDAGQPGERIFFHYPRLQTMAGAEEAAIPLSGKKSGRAGAGAAQGAVSGAAGYRPAGWRAGAVLPELPARANALV